MRSRIKIYIRIKYSEILYAKLYYVFRNKRMKAKTTKQSQIFYGDFR